MNGLYRGGISEKGSSGPKRKTNDGKKRAGARKSDPATFCPQNPPTYNKATGFVRKESFPNTKKFSSLDTNSKGGEENTNLY